MPVQGPPGLPVEVGGGLGTPIVITPVAAGTTPGVLGSAPTGGGNMASTWTVTGTRQSTMSNGQTFVPSVIVSFVTGLGNYGNVELAASSATATAVQAAVQQAADFLDGISQMSNGSGATASPLG